VSSDFSGQLKPDGVEGVELRFFDCGAMPDKINPKMGDPFRPGVF